MQSITHRHKHTSRKKEKNRVSILHSMVYGRMKLENLWIIWIFPFLIWPWGKRGPSYQSLPKKDIKIKWSLFFYWNEFFWLSYWSEIHYSQLKIKKKFQNFPWLNKGRISLIFYNKLRIVSSRSTKCNTLEFFLFGLLFLYQQPINNERCCSVHFWLFFLKKGERFFTQCSNRLKEKRQ